MPSGIPPSISVLVQTAQEKVTYFVTYLQIPSYSETSSHFQIAFADTVKAWKSTHQFIQLTCRPFVILLALISRYILIVLRILSEHTIYHVILAAKEFWRQFKIAVIWFIAFQKGLSRTAIFMEIGFILLCIGLYMIRRYLQRKKYFQKLARWYRSKKRNVQMKYNNFVDTVAQTSLILALLLPHILYMIITLVLKYFTPSLIRYLATNTILADVISFYIPFVKTVVVLFKYKKACMLASIERKEFIIATSKARKKDDRDDRATDENKSSGLFSFLQKSSSSKSSVADAYNKATSKSSSGSSERKKFANSKKYSIKESEAPKQLSTTLKSDELSEISQEAAEWLKYWTVYAILTACIQTATLVPILGRIFYNANPVNANKAAASVSRWSTGKKRTSILEKIKLSTRFLEECKLFFFAWLRLLPTSFTSLSRNNRDEREDGKNGSRSSDKHKSALTGSVKNRIKELEKQSKTSSIRRKHQKANSETPFSNQPLDIMYKRLAPIAISLVATSTNAVNVTNNYNDDNNLESSAFHSFKTKCVTFCQTFLNAMVWTKIISESTKTLILNTFSQCTSLLPAAVTLMMPSYFTSFGVIYVRLMVPCANSSSAYDGFHKLEKDLQNGQNIIDNDGFVDDRWITNSFSILQYLQYWTIHAIFSSILLSFAPVLAWIPFSTHMIWLFWAYIQLEANTKKIYSSLEWELEVFGILKIDPSLSSNSAKKLGEGRFGNEADLKKTMTMQLLDSIITKIPSSHSVDDSNENSKTTKQNETEEVPKDKRVKSSSGEKKNIEGKLTSKQVIDEKKQLEETNDESKLEESTNSNITNTPEDTNKEDITRTDSLKQKTSEIRDLNDADGYNNSYSSDDNDFVCISEKIEK